MSSIVRGARLLASALLLCVCSPASAADEPDKGAADQIKQLLDLLKQQQQAPYSKYTVNSGSLVIESWILTSAAIDATADNIARFVNAAPGFDAKRRILVVAATEPIDFGQVPMMELEIQALTDRIARTCK